MFGFGKKNNKNDINILAAYDMVVDNQSNPEFIIIDVRSPQEFKEGRIEDAKNIDYNSKNFKDELSKLQKDAMYLVYCRSGRRSSNAVKRMNDLGFKDVKNMKGGITRWNKEGLPIKV